MLSVCRQEQEIREYQWRAVDQAVKVHSKQDLDDAFEQLAIVFDDQLVLSHKYQSKTLDEAMGKDLVLRIACRLVIAFSILSIT